MNPMNPARAVPFRDGAVAIPDRETFESLSYKGRDVPYHRHLQDLEFVKFYIIGVATDNMGIYFMNTETHRIHPDFGMQLVSGTTHSGDRGTWAARSYTTQMWLLPMVPWRLPLPVPAYGCIPLRRCGPFV